MVDRRSCLHPIFLCLSLLFMVCFSADEDSYAGSKCTNSGIPGICQEVYDCPIAIESLKKWHKHELKRCGFRDVVEIVCCPTLETKSPTLSGQERFNGIEFNDYGDDNDAGEGRIGIRKSLQACNFLGNQSTRVGIIFHIIDGEDAVEKEFPHMAALGYDTDDGLSWDCGASVISNRFLLTAAHCFARSVRPARARVGVTWLNATNPQDVDILNITTHPSYDPTSKHDDIALVELRDNLTFSDSVYPACLYQGNDDPLGLIVTGWGKTSIGNEDDRSLLLQKAKLSGVPIDQCNTTYVTRSLGSRTILSTQLCAAGKRSDACWGDSGGPIQIREKTGTYSIVGIISYGAGCGGRVPGVYTRVSKYLDWIENIVFK